MLCLVGEEADWHGHVIVCGLDGVGLRIVEQLALSGVPAVVVDDNPAPTLAQMIATWGVPLVTGPTRAEETLTAAGLSGAVAVICAQDGDLAALETALLARRLRAEVRVIAQLTNPAVGRAVREAGVRVLDVAGLSAPSVVEVCLDEGVQEMSLSGMRFLAARTTAPYPATLRTLYGALAPVAVVPRDGDVLIAPGRDTPVHAGDEVTLIGTPDQLAAVSVIDHPERIRRLTATAAAAPSGPGPAAASYGVLGVLAPEESEDAPRYISPAGRAARALRDLTVSLARAADRRIAIALAALLAVLVTATLILRFTYQLAGPGHRISLIDAVYFTVETVTTVGYGDFSFRDEPTWLVVFAILLMMTGALFVAVFFALVTNMLVSRRIEESLGRQKITGLRGHVLVIGLGTIGLRVARQLHDAGRDVVVIEKSEHNRHLAQLRGLGINVLVADATLPEVLDAAKLSAASAVAILTSDDLANLETGLAVRDQLGERWKKTPVVLRIFDWQLAHSVKETFGFMNVRSTAALAAPWFVGAALGLEVLSTFYAGDEPLLVARLTVTPGGGLHGLRMDELAARTRVLALRRAADRSVLEHPPRRSTRFEPADEAYLIGPYDELLTVLRRDRPSPSLADNGRPDNGRPDNGRQGADPGSGRAGGAQPGSASLPQGGTPAT
jgi:Trk K+ transport system NAD-binding subunit